MRTHLLLLCCAALACGGRTGRLQVETRALDEALQAVPPGVPPWTHLDAGTIGARTAVAADVAAVMWDADKTLLDGWLLVYMPGPIEKDLAAGLVTHGETRWGPRDILIDVWGGGGACLESTGIAHEVGHIVLDGDGGHTDPRWHDASFWHEMALRLADAAPADDVRCRELLSQDLMAGNRGT